MVRLTEKQSIVAFDPAATPAVEIAPGEEVEAEILDWCFGEVDDRPETYPRAARTPRCPAAGPIAVRGAAPGDALAVEILELRTRDRGFMVVRAGCGPLGERVKGIEVVRIPIEDGHALLPSGARVPVEPMIGVIGAAPEKGAVPTLWAGDHGGNMDTREIGPGATVFLPVRVPGGLLAFGDVHAAMGDGELAGSGVEVGASVRVRVGLARGARLPRPRVVTPRRFITLATREDPREAIRMATEDMVAWLGEAAGMSFRDATLLVGAAGSLRVSQVVNRPGPTVKLLLDRARVGMTG